MIENIDMGILFTIYKKLYIYIVYLMYSITYIYCSYCIILFLFINI